MAKCSADAIKKVESIRQKFKESMREDYKSLPVKSDNARRIYKGILEALSDKENWMDKVEPLLSDFKIFKKPLVNRTTKTNGKDIVEALHIESITKVEGKNNVYLIKYYTGTDYKPADREIDANGKVLLEDSKASFSVEGIKRAIAVLNDVESEVEVVGAKKKSKFKQRDKHDYELAIEDNINNIDNALELADTLYNIGTTEVSEEHRNSLNEVLKLFVNPLKQFIPKMNAYVKENANENDGILQIDGNDITPRGIYIDVGRRGRPVKKEMSPMETYVHETVHAATEYAFRLNNGFTSATKSRLRKIYTKAMKEITVEDLMDPNSGFSSEEERAHAEAMLKYMKNKETGLREFITHGLTNERMISRLKDIQVKTEQKKATNIWEMLKNVASSIIETAFNIARHETKNQDMHKLLTKLSLDLAETNNAANELSSSFTVLEKGSEAIDKANKFISDMFDGVGERAQGMKLTKRPPGAGAFQRTLWMLRNLIKLAGDDTSRADYEYMLSGLGMKPEGFVQTVLRGFSVDDSLQETVENMVLLSGNVDQNRETMATQVGNAVILGFKEKPTKKEQEAITVSILDTDVQSLIEDMSIDDIGRIMNDEAELDKEIARETANIKKNASEADYYYYWLITVVMIHSC